MLFEERSINILKLLDVEDFVTTTDLVRILNVSEATIRRDLKALEEEDKLIRIHGGAKRKELLKIEQSYKEKTISFIEEKKRIAKYAANLVEKQDFIYLDAGSTTYEMIPFLADKDITVVTNGLMHINKLMEYSIKSYLIGGFIKESTGALIGSIALGNLELVNFSKSFIGVNGMDIKAGFTTPDLEEGKLKSKAIDNSIQSFILADKSKFNKIYFYKIKDLKKGIIITDTKEKDLDKYSQITKIIGV